MLSLSRAAIELLASPSALLKMMRARSLNDRASERLRAYDVSCTRSWPLNTNSFFGLPLVSPSRYLPSQRYRKARIFYAS